MVLFVCFGLVGLETKVLKVIFCETVQNFYDW